jgi:hypothetical protein
VKLATQSKIAGFTELILPQAQDDRIQRRFLRLRSGQAPTAATKDGYLSPIPLILLIPSKISPAFTQVLHVPPVLIPLIWKIW